VESTPFCCEKDSSGCQNHPRANVTELDVADWIGGESLGQGSVIIMLTCASVVVRAVVHADLKAGACSASSIGRPSNWMRKRRCSFRVLRSSPRAPRHEVLAAAS
jgi:hypothetical protein